MASLCSDADIDPPLGDAVEISLLEPFQLTAICDIRSTHGRVESRPFDSTRKLMSTLHVVPGGFEMLTKGAPEQVLAVSTRFMRSDGGSPPLTPESRAAVLSRVEALAEQGGRILALAYRPLDVEPVDVADSERDLVLIGLAVLTDPLRPEAAATVSSVTEAGVHLVMVTGDHAGTASAVAHAVGLAHEDTEVMTGNQLRVEGVPSSLSSIKVFARVDPEQKLQLVDAFQAEGQVVAVTGDGVNDAPALRKADIGVAMGLGGSQVAREAVDLVITDDDLNLVTRAVKEGRAIYDNIRKVVDYLVAGNISEVTVVLAGLAAFPGLGIPLFPIQLLWINLLTDGLPALALGFDRPRHDLAFRPAGLRSSQLLSGRRLAMLAGRGVLLAAGSIGALALARAGGASWEESRTVMFVALVVSHLLYAFIVRLPAKGNFFNGRLMAAVGIGLALQVATVLGPFTDFFQVVTLTLDQWLLAIGAGVAPVVLLGLIEILRPARRQGESPSARFGACSRMSLVMAASSAFSGRRRQANTIVATAK